MNGTTNASNIGRTDIPIDNVTTIHSQTVTAPATLSALMDIPIQVAGTYLIVSRIEIANAPVGAAILGVSKTYNQGWGISKTNTSTDYVRLTVSDVEVMSSTDHVYVNFYNGFGSAQTVDVRTTITRLA